MDGYEETRFEPAFYICLVFYSQTLVGFGASARSRRASPSPSSRGNHYTSIRHHTPYYSFTRTTSILAIVELLKYLLDIKVHAYSLGHP